MTKFLKWLSDLFQNKDRDKLKALLEGLGAQNVDCFMNNAEPEDYRKYGEGFKRKD